MQIINQIEQNDFVIEGTTELIAPEDLSVEFPLRFFDTSADGRLTPIDALRILNGVFRGDGEAEVWPIAPEVTIGKPLTVAHRADGEQREDIASTPKQVVVETIDSDVIAPVELQATTIHSKSHPRNHHDAVDRALNEFLLD